MATPSKAQFLNEVHALLKKRYKPKPDPSPGRLTVLEAVVYGICHEGTTREQANQALSRFKDDFFDWNEVRVSSVDEIQGVLAGLPDPEDRAHRLRRFLRQLFEKTYGFNLEPLAKKPLKESVKALHEYEAFGVGLRDWPPSIQQALGGPRDPRRRPDPPRPWTGWASPSPTTDIAALRGHPRARGPQEPRRRVRRPDRGAGARHLRRGRARLPPLRAAQDLPHRDWPARKSGPRPRPPRRSSQGRLDRSETRPRRDHLGWRHGRTPEAGQGEDPPYQVKRRRDRVDPGRPPGRPAEARLGLAVVE